MGRIRFRSVKSVMDNAKNQDPPREAAAHGDAVRGSNQSGMRAHNERLVLTLVRQMGPLPKAEIARMTGLSAQTVSVIMRALEADGLLEKGAPIRGKVGQPSVPMGLVAQGAYFLGLKIGRRSLEMILVDFLGRVQGRAQTSHRFPEPDAVVRFAEKAMTQLLGKLPVQHRKRLAGLGIAMPYRLWEWADALKVDPAQMAAWQDRDVAAEIAQRLEVPVYLQNDASAACGAELVFGDQDKPRNFLYFFVGFFVGGGLVLDNALYTGRTGNAAALGSAPVPSGDGQMRQLVDLASLATLEKALLNEGGNSDQIWGDSQEWAVPAHLLEHWLDGAAQGLAHVIAGSVCLIEFDCVVIDGWMPDHLREALVARTVAQLKRSALPGIDVPDIRVGTIGSDARALGAASLPLSNRFLVDRNALWKG